MSNNPIKSSDLYQDDGAIQEAIKQMEALREVYVKNLDAITKEAEKLMNKLNEVNTTTKEGQETTRRAATDAEKLKNAQREYATALNETNTKIRALKDAKRQDIKLQKLQEKAVKSAKGSYNQLSAQYALNKLRLNAMSKAERDATKSGKALEKQTREIYEEMNRLQKATGKHQLQVGKYPKIIPGVTKLFAGLVGTFGVIEGIKLFKGVFADIAAVKREAKGIDFAFKQIADGEEILKRTREATRGVLSDLDIKKSANEFKNFNLDVEKLPELLEFVAVRAAQTGKSFEGLRDSLVEGLSKESKLRIDNLGISTQELNAELKKTPNFIQAVANIAQREVGKAGRVLDEAANSQEQFNANLENFKAAAGTGFISNFTNAMYSLGSSIIKAITPAKDLRTQFEEQAANVIDLQTNLVPLIDEYDTLKDKTELSNVEQERLETVIEDISKIVPTAITAFDEYGNALDISSDKARDFIGTQKALLKFRNKEAIEEEKEALEDYRHTIRDVQAQLSRRDADGDIARPVMKGGKIARVEMEKLSGEYIQKLQARLAEAQLMEKGALESINQLNGDYLDKYVKREEAKTKKTLEELQKRAKELKINIEGRSAAELKALIAQAERNAANYDKLKALRDKAHQEELNKKKLVANAIENAQQRELALLEIELGEKKKKWIGYGLDVNTFEEWAARQRAAINKKWTDKEVSDKKAAADKIAKDKRAALAKTKKEFDTGVGAIDQQRALADSEIDLMQKTEAEKTKLRLEAEKKRLQAILDLNKRIGGQLTDLQIKQMQNVIKKLDQEIKNVGSGDQKDIYDLVGLKLDSDQKAAISESVSFALDNVRNMLAARVEAADIMLQKAQEETDAAQSRYDQEIEARNNGYANNVLNAQRELELKKRQEQAALKEKQKAQKAQEAIDTAMQVSGLITSSVQIWKALAGIPVIGPGLAAAAVGVMWASYAASKIKAKSVAKEKFGEGGLEFLQGGSHASGNDIPIGTTKSGKQRTAEGGEAMAIIKKSSTRKYKGILPNLINSLNKGTFEQTYSNAFIPAEQMPPIINAGYDSVDLKQTEEHLAAIRANGEVQRYTDGEGRLVEVYKNVTRVYV